jgi:acyl-CoA synthetase (NDP forming)
MKMGTGQLASFLTHDFEGAIYPVHPTEKEVLGLTAYPSVADLPEVPDLAVLVLPTGIVPEIMDECGGAGVEAAVVVSGGFREVGGEGGDLEKKLVDIVRKHDITMIGPNCIGVGNFRIGLNTTYFPYLQEPGDVTVISQSGTYSCHIYGYTEKLGLRLSHTVSVGNSAVTDLSDCLEYFADEPNTRSIALYIEGIRDGEKFLRAARYAVGRKPVVALYVGGTVAGARAGMTHTGALAGDDAIYDGILEQAGILRAYTIEQLLDWSWALAALPPAPGKRICVLSNAGGPAASMADSCNRAGLEVPVFSSGLQKKLRDMLPHTAAVVNPVDMTYYMDFEGMYQRVPRMILESGEIDGVVMYGMFGSLLYRTIEGKLGGRIDYKIEQVMPRIWDIIERFIELPNDYGKPIAVSSFWAMSDDALSYLAGHGIPVFPSPERAVKAMAALAHRHDQKMVYDGMENPGREPGGQS